MTVTLGELAERFDLTLAGDAATMIDGVCSLAPGQQGRLAYLADPKQAATLPDTRASAVIVTSEQAGNAPGAYLVAPDPKLAFAHIAALFDTPPRPAGVHASAVVDPGAQVHAEAWIGPRAVVEADARVAAGAQIHAGAYIGNGCEVGEGSTLGPNVVLRERVRIGAGCRIGSGSVIGERGFGLAQDGGRWVTIPQLGGVEIGDDVEIGANCTIDRGALGDTRLENGAKLDDQIHIAHNCRIGAHTVIAGCSGVAGSTDIGAHCLLGGAVGVADHLKIADGVIITGGAQVHSDIAEPGMYSGQFRAMPHKEWFKRLILFKGLDKIDARIRKLEKQASEKQ